MIKKDKMEALYKKYYIDRNFEREEVFTALKEKYAIKSVLYPGSFVHITPSFIFPKTTYIDSDKGALSFFDDMTFINEMAINRKKYQEDTTIQFFGQNYNSPLPLAKESFDLLISHYGGIISQPCKKYLKIGGLLLVNNSHADAGVAYLDDNFTLIATINCNRKNKISEENLSSYFIPKKQQNITITSLINSQKGIGYTTTADLYIFKKIR
ncbi:hypothetical protein [Flavobacterium sp.]|uniref:hypothetical protein n=1 Tax=Flavobacterium sp. TaxID=239 RepID=UPI0040480CDB